MDEDERIAFDTENGNWQAYGRYWTWRATLSDNHATWGYGDTLWEAISDVCDVMQSIEWDEQQNANQS